MTTVSTQTHTMNTKIMVDKGTMTASKDELIYKTPHHKELYRYIKNNYVIPSEKQIVEKRWYVFQYMEPTYPDKIIQCYSTGKLGPIKKMLCVNCGGTDHFKVDCRDKLNGCKKFCFNF
tara:strand:+ start:270 stop:626 length:357 start_codon:yes stop_codon:yes gene_type:complete